MLLSVGLFPEFLRTVVYQLWERLPLLYWTFRVLIMHLFILFFLLFLFHLLLSCINLSNWEFFPGRLLQWHLLRFPSIPLLQSLMPYSFLVSSAVLLSRRRDSLLGERTLSSTQKNRNQLFFGFPLGWRLKRVAQIVIYRSVPLFLQVEGVLKKFRFFCLCEGRYFLVSGQ